MKKVKVAIVGAGNISNTRHIPALKKMKSVEICGVIGIRRKNIDRTAKQHGIENTLLIENGSFSEAMKKCEWLKSIDAIVIGAPPREHFVMVEAALLNNKHVLVEKPMTMDTNEADILIKLAKKQQRQLCVMHNFQFAAGMRKLESLIENGSLGDIVSFDEFQLTNKHRRLPEWYNDLPLGLFYDEAPHFMYLLERFGGKLKIENSFAYASPIKDDNTPTLLSVSLKAGSYPAHIFLNFESPICEWFFVVSGTKKIIFYDLFKDILIVLPSDNEHYATDILKNSWRATIQYWVAFIKNGFMMVTGNLLYGHEIVMQKFINAIEKGEEVDQAINGHSGRRTVKYMQDIIDTTVLHHNRAKD
jgi:predicted dehydrogenase